MGGAPVCWSKYTTKGSGQLTDLHIFLTNFDKKYKLTYSKSKKIIVKGLKSSLILAFTQSGNTAHNCNKERQKIITASVELQEGRVKKVYKRWYFEGAKDSCI